MEYTRNLSSNSLLVMARGPKKHLKRLNAPKHWMLDKLGGMWAPRPSTGPHKMRECLPIILCLRNRLKYALTGKEASMICMEKHVQVDGRVRTDPNFPCGFMDVLELKASNDKFRLLYDTKGRFVLHRLKNGEEKYKLCRVRSVAKTKKNVPYLVTHDARYIRYPDPVISTNDTIKVDIASGKITEHIKFDTGIMVMVTKGRNTGRVGQLVHVEKHPGSFDIVQIKDKAGHSFATRQENVFGIGTHDADGEPRSMISLPKAKGIKLSVQQEMQARLQKEK